MEDENRYIDNKFPSEPTDSFTLDIVRQQVAEIFIKDYTIFLQKVKADEKRAICSVSSQSSLDISNFEGAGSYVSVYVELLNFLSQMESLSDGEKEGLKGLLGSYKGSELLTSKELMNRAQTSFDGLYALIKESEKNSKRIEVSYYFGAPGLLMNGCFISYHKGDKKSFFKYISEILAYKKVIISNRAKYYKEILYGIAGYLYCLLLLQEKFSNPTNPEFKVNLTADVRDIVEIILEDGLEKWGDVNLQNPPKDFRLFYTFHDREYFGGAHGLFGVLQILMKAYILNKDSLEKETESLAEALKLCISHSFNYLLAFQLPSGNFPTSEKRKADDKLVQFCHGSPGAIPALLTASHFFKGEKLGENCLKAALNAGQNIWQHGILKKGYGLCHGIAGNAYSLIKLFNVTNDSKWIYRAYCLLSAKSDKHYTDTIDNYEFQDRHVVGKSDYPYSLMLGLAGDLCIEAGALLPTAARFPGFDF